jgi:hypothetical protein
VDFATTKNIHLKVITGERESAGVDTSTTFSKQKGQGAKHNFIQTYKVIKKKTNQECYLISFYRNVCLGLNRTDNYNGCFLKFGV